MLSDALVWITNACMLGFFIEPGWHVAPECSGINSVKAMLLLFGVFGVVRRLTIINYVKLIVFTFLAAVVQNIVRVTILVLLDGVLPSDVWQLLHGFFGYITAFIAMLVIMRFLDGFQKIPFSKLHL